MTSSHVVAPIIVSFAAGLAPGHISGVKERILLGQHAQPLSFALEKNCAPRLLMHNHAPVQKL